MKSNFQFLTLFFIVITILFACNTEKPTNSNVETVTKKEQPKKDVMAPPEWVKNANMYEVNLRNYTEEGTLAAFKKHLPRLKDMGVDILWFMPIHPISEVKRKAKDDLLVKDVKDEAERAKYKGSPYAVQDYKAINPDFATMEEFKTFVKDVQALGMRVIIDWVPNHTGWDHRWITEHPDWYTKNDKGEIIDPINPETKEPWGWTDVADLNYDNSDMREAMVEAMQFWLKETNIDGFRVDVAHGVPTNFWDDACPRLMKTKECLLLAEAAVPYLINSGNFHLDYGWPFHHLMNDIAKGKKNASDIDAYLKEDKTTHSKGFHLHFTSNHDENAWNGTTAERMGEAHDALAVLAATFDGMPLIYSGQEEPLTKRLDFFAKDIIPFNDYKKADFYKTLFLLKKNNQALWNGDWGGQLQRISTKNDESIYAFQREKDGDKVIVFLNLTDQLQKIQLDETAPTGVYSNVFENSTFDLKPSAEMTLNPWGYMVLARE